MRLPSEDTMTDLDDFATGSPVRVAPDDYGAGDSPAKEPTAGIGLCLSGGGYRAMLACCGG